MGNGLAPSKQLLREMSLVGDIVGRTWLDKQSSRWHARDWQHPLVSDWHFAEQALKQGDTAIKASEHATRIRFLGANISALRETQFDKVRLRQRLRDNEDTEKAAYELQIAAAYKRAGYEVQFGDVGEYGHDLTAWCEREPIFLECKKKGAETEKDRAVLSIWKELSARIFELMDKIGLYAYLWLMAKADPKAQDVNGLIGAVERYLRQSSSGSWSLRCNENEYVLNLSSILTRGAEVISDAKKLEVWWRFDERPEFMVANVEIGRDSEGKAHIKNPRATAFKSQEQRDYVTGVLQSFDEVRRRRQLPPQGPGLIYIDVPLPSQVPVEHRFKELAEAIGRKLKTVNRRVNAVVLTHMFVQKRDKEGTKECYLVWISCVIKHPNPQTQLPQTFRIVTATDVNFSIAP